MMSHVRVKGEGQWRWSPHGDCVLRVRSPLLMAMNRLEPIFVVIAQTFTSGRWLGVENAWLREGLIDGDDVRDEVRQRTLTRIYGTETGLWVREGLIDG